MSSWELPECGHLECADPSTACSNDADEIPETEGEAAEVDINFVPDDFGIKVTAVLGESSIVVEHSWEAAEEAATLVQALPNIMIAVQQALDAQEEQT